jgi:seryl-tRNA synthetase
MKKGLTIVALIALLFNFSYAQKLSKDETKRIKDELKEYMKHPETYKAKVDQAKADKDASDAQITSLKGEAETAKATADDLQKKLADDDAKLAQMQEESDKAKEAVATAKESDMKTAPKGTVYKIQLGMYKGFNVNKYFDQSRYLGYEQVDGMNRYVISYFPDEETALKFVNDIRKLGIRDAFVAKYIDGTRVYEWSENPKYKGKKVPNSLEEALGQGKPTGKGKPVKQDDNN